MSGEERTWCTARVRCRICGAEHASVWPADIVDETRQECPSCGHEACEPIEDIIEGPFEVDDDVRKAVEAGG